MCVCIYIFVGRMIIALHHYTLCGGIDFIFVSPPHTHRAEAHARPVMYTACTVYVVNMYTHSTHDTQTHTHRNMRACVVFAFLCSLG